MGRQTAIEAAIQGATVIVAARRLEACEDVAATVNSNGGQAMALHLDGTDPASVDAVVKAIDTRFGRLDCVFNNLGATLGNSPFHETPLERWQDTINTNLHAVFYLMRAEIPLLKKSGGGAIINNSSAAGLRGVLEMADYSAAKWGVIGLTKSAALETNADNIRINVIAPGIIQTEKFASFKTQMPELFENLRAAIPGGKFGEMQDIAHFVTWLMSDEARYLNGAVLPIDAGQTAG